MHSFETPADVFTRLYVFDSPKGSSNTLKTQKNISLYFKRRYLIIYKYLVTEQCFETKCGGDSLPSMHLTNANIYISVR